MPLLTSAIAVAIIVGLLALAGCGGDEAATTAVAADDDPAIYEIDAGEFVADTDKESILDEFVAAEPNNCSEVDEGLVLSISSAATEVPPDTPLSEVIEDMCGEPTGDE
jgi:hypothetical protein